MYLSDPDRSGERVPAVRRPRLTGPVPDPDRLLLELVQLQTAASAPPLPADPEAPNEVLFCICITPAVMLVVPA